MLSKNQLKYYSSLKKKKFREQEKRFLVEGVRTCEEILNSDFEIEILLYCPPALSSKRATRILEKYRSSKIPVQEINTRELKLISTTIHSQGIIAIAKMMESNLEQLLSTQPQNLLVVESLSDPGNLGTILRSAAWFGLAGVLLSQNCVEITNPKVVRASMGAIFHLPIVERLHLIRILQKLRELRYSIYATDVHGETEYFRADFKDPKNVLIVGSEAEGVSNEIKEMATAVLRIPKCGKGESLNVAVAAGILMAKLSQSGEPN